MGSTGTFAIGAAGAVPLRAAAVRPSRFDGWVATAPVAAPVQGTGLSSVAAFGAMEPGTSFVRPWGLALVGTTAHATVGTTAHATATTVVPARLGGYAERIAGTTPGALPPSGLLS